MMYLLLIVLDLLVAFLLQQQERAAYLQYLLMNSFEVKR